MASSTLIGTAPDQVPTNGDLGDLAFQNKESIEFYDGHGGLGHLDITAISRQLSVSAIDVFIYDTSKDSDGGAWRKRCQHTSWYNETLNTATRGSRREFPAVAVIVATTNSITIYDGDVPDMPMWMTVTGGGATFLFSAPVTAVAALNGTLCFTVNPSAGAEYWDAGLKCMYFISDELNTYSYGRGYIQFGGIITRNLTSTQGAVRDYSSGTYHSIISPNANDVAMTVLPNAPIDDATGLPIPTIAVATDGGVSVLKDDGSVVSYALSAIGGVDLGGIVVVSFDELKNLWISQSHRTGNFGANLKICPSPYSSTPVTVYGWNGYVGAPYLISYGFGGGAETIRHVVPTNSYNIATGFNYTVNGLCYIAHNSQNRDNSMVANIKTNHNTGWMPGNIKGAWLSDNTQETVVGTELVTNGTFDSNTSGWLANGSGYHTFSAISGALSVTRGSYGLGGGEPYQAVSVIPGKFYRVSFVGASGDMSMSLGSTIGGSQYVSWGSTGASTLREFTFLATTSTVYILFICNSTGTTASIDNVSIRLADPDRSFNNKGLQVFGNITKTPVAAGADLVAYSGFSSSNYLQQPYNSSIPVAANSELMFATWVKTSQVVSSACILFAISNLTGGQARYLYLNEGKVTLDTYGGGFTSTRYIADDRWHFVVGMFRANGSAETYVDGAKADYCAAFTNGTAALPAGLPLWIGSMASAGGTTPLSGSMALSRVSATLPSAEQIAKMYNDEKVLFQDNAKATLYGTSDAVTALAYDEDTNLLHVGTSSGRSVFNGLRRVDNTTDAVGACISAADGLVVED